MRAKFPNLRFLQSSHAMLGPRRYIDYVPRGKVMALIIDINNNIPRLQIKCFVFLLVVMQRSRMACAEIKDFTTIRFMIYQPNFVPPKLLDCVDWPTRNWHHLTRQPRCCDRPANFSDGLIDIGGGDDTNAVPAGDGPHLAAGIVSG